jgi:hypothetical protein
MIAGLILSLALKSALIAGAGLLCARGLARGAADRANILRATVCLLLALPVVALALPVWELALLPASSATEPTASAPLWQGEIGPVAGVAIEAAMPWPSPLGLAALAWLAGGLFVAGRLVLGVMTLDRWTSEGQAVTCPAWRAALDRLCAGRQPRLVVSERLPGPLSWGVPPGTILIDPASLSDTRTAEAVLAHELAHLRRGDWLFLILSRLALALFWFNPLVWVLHAALVARTEEATDAAAVSRVDRQTYAHALVRLASQPAANTALPWSSTAMAGDARSLKKRIDCLMTDHAPHARPLTVAATVAALSLLATPLAALQVTQDPPLPPPAPAAPPAPPAPPVPLQVLAPLSPPPAPPAPPLLPSRRLQDPPAPPAPPPGARLISYGQATPEERAEVDRARAEARVARGQAEVARVQAEQARAEAVVAREQAAVARRDAGRQMAEGAEQMLVGARQMREEATRLEDPAYRAAQISENRARGQVVTDAELRALGLRLRQQAEDMERQALEMRERAGRMG